MFAISVIMFLSLLMLGSTLWNSHLVPFDCFPYFFKHKSDWFMVLLILFLLFKEFLYYWRILCSSILFHFYRTMMRWYCPSTFEFFFEKDKGWSKGVKKCHILHGGMKMWYVALLFIICSLILILVFFFFSGVGNCRLEATGISWPQGVYWCYAGNWCIWTTYTQILFIFLGPDPFFLLNV